MVLAMAVLLFQFPAATTPANAIRDPISAMAPAFKVEIVVPSASATPASSTSKAGTAANPTTAGSAKPSAPAQPSKPAFKDENAPAAERIIHSFQPPTGSIAQLTGPSFSEVILPAPPFRPPYELPATDRRLWLALSTAEHSAATYDAWSTRRALATGRIEADPLMRPFAGSVALYPAIQLVPFGLDYLAHRLQRSSGWTRHIWWVPQSAATVTFLISGSYNVAHTN